MGVLVGISVRGNCFVVADVGIAVGFTVETIDGLRVGVLAGIQIGTAVGDIVGEVDIVPDVGSADVRLLGISEGLMVGVLVGECVGKTVDVADGSQV